METQKENINEKEKKHMKFSVISICVILALVLCSVLTIRYCNNRERENIIAASKENIAPYLDTLGQEAVDGDISILPEAAKNSNNVNFLNVIGSVSSHYTNESDTQIRAIEWVSNKHVSKEEFHSFISYLNMFEGSDYTIRSYDVLSNKTYVWYDYSTRISVACWFYNNEIHVRWYYNKNLLVSPPSTPTVTPAPTSTPTPTSKPTPNPTTAPTNPPQQNTRQSSSNKSNKYEVLCGVPCVFSNYKVTYNSFSLSSDYEGNTVIIENLTFENLSQEARPFFTTASVTMYQDGIELENAYFVNGYDAGLSQRKLQQGGILDIQEAHILRNTTSPVYIEISDWISINGIKYTGVIPLS